MSEPEKAKPLLEAHSLRKDYGGLVALADLSLAVNAGEVVGLLGPNGAGKTTALRMMAAILTPTSGTASVCGYDVIREPLKVKDKLGFQSGDTALYKRLTPRELIKYFGRLHGMSDDAIKERSAYLIEKLDMAEFVDRSCDKLSAGQQQRANISRTLMHEPPVLILDEPTNALDIISGKFILESIQTAREEKKAILFSTHIMSEAEYLCDRIILLHEGHVIARGTLSELRENSGHENLTEIFLHYIEEADTCAGES